MSSVEPRRRAGPVIGAALAAVLPRLRCPVCRDGLRPDGGRVVCPLGHSHDVARGGQLTLTGGRRVGGDTADMVAARTRFLDAGHFAPLTSALVDAVRSARTAVGVDPASPFPTAPVPVAVTPVPDRVPDLIHDLVVDLASGPGQHLSAVLDTAPHLLGVAVDSAPAALRGAARRHARMAAVGADAWRELPIVDGAAAVVLSVFGPRRPTELARLLAPAGILAVVTPTPQHLHELRARLGLLAVPAAKAETLAARLTAPDAGFDALAVTAVRFIMNLPPPAVRDVVAMGPSAHHVDDATRAAAAPDDGDPAPVTASVQISTFRRRLDRPPSN